MEQTSTEFPTWLQKLIEKLRENETIMNFVNSHSSEEMGTIFTILAIVITIVLFALIIFITIKTVKFLLKRNLLIDFSWKDVVASWGVIFIPIDIYFVATLVIGKGELLLIFPTVIFLALGIYGIVRQKYKIEIIKSCGFKGIKVFTRWITSFVCGVIGIPFAGVMLGISIIRGFPSFVMESFDDKNEGKKKLVEYGYMIDKDGNRIYTTTYNHKSGFSETVSEDKNGNKHTFYSD